MLNKQISAFLANPSGGFNYFLDKVITQWILFKKNIEIDGRLTVKGVPLIDIKKGSKLFIGHNVTLNSRNRGHHINLHSSVKLFADRSGATIRIGNNTRIHGSCLHAYQEIVIGNNCLIAANCQIFDGNAHDLSFPDVENRIHTRGRSKPVLIEDNVWIGANSIVLPGAKIGKGSVISASSVVINNIPPMVVAGGNPAIVIKTHQNMKM
jgi:acetyltransferase-like isoleucine patch superfamily enzyme